MEDQRLVLELVEAAIGAQVTLNVMPGPTLEEMLIKVGAVLVKWNGIEGCTLDHARGRNARMALGRPLCGGPLLCLLVPSPIHCKPRTSEEALAARDTGRVAGGGGGA